MTHRAVKDTLHATCSGRLVDLLDPRPCDIDFGDIFEQLAKEARFNGATPGCAYSVAEHTARGAKVMRALGGDRLAAAYFVTHDFHEYILKDDPTPKKRALDRIAVENFGVLAGAVKQAFGRLTDRWDAAIHQAAGLDWPPPAPIAAMVEKVDLIMLATEWRDLMRHMPALDLGPDIAPWPDAIVPHDWFTAKALLKAAAERYLPVFGCQVSGAGYQDSSLPDA
jgi:hypothetical protein